MSPFWKCQEPSPNIKRNLLTPIRRKWAEIYPHEPTNIENEGFFQLVTLRRKAAQQKVMSKPTSGKPGGPMSNDCARPTQPNGNLIKWRPRDTAKMSADDIIVVLKPRETLHLKTAFQTGNLGAAIAQDETSDLMVGYQTQSLAQANDFVMPKWPSCKSRKISFRHESETTTHEA
ncbi:hypothetical protein MRX96_011376 [Rhipicephalus microplus]